MLRPKLPAPPAFPAQHNHAAACTCQHPPAATAPPSNQLAPYVRLGLGVAGAVLVVGVVLTALLVAVAVAAVSVALVAVVLRSLLAKPNNR